MTLTRASWSLHPDDEAADALLEGATRSPWIPNACVAHYIICIAQCDAPTAVRRQGEQVHTLIRHSLAVAALSTGGTSVSRGPQRHATLGQSQ